MINYKKYTIKPTTNTNLDKFNPTSDDEFKEGKEASLPVMAKLAQEIGEIQEKLYASRSAKVLVIVQALDTGGKDGLIRGMFREVNPQGVRVESFKVPTTTELDHDYLWRIHKVVPGKGELVVFNRSHYEDVLVARVRKLVPEEVWEKRFRHINEFEKMLVDEGTLILKFFLHISKEEQKQRLLARLEDPNKHWKFSPGDLDDRALWTSYMKAYEDVLSKTSTEEAPWWIIPADRKWYRDLIAATIFVNETQKLKLEFPKVAFDPSPYRSKLLSENS